MQVVTPFLYKPSQKSCYFNQRLDLMILFTVVVAAAGVKKKTLSPGSIAPSVVSITIGPVDSFIKTRCTGRVSFACLFFYMLCGLP